MPEGPNFIILKARHQQELRDLQIYLRVGLGFVEDWEVYYKEKQMLRKVKEFGIKIKEKRL